MYIVLIWKENISNRAIFPCLFIAKYFDFSASTGGFDLSLLTISGPSVSYYIEILYDNLTALYFCCRFVVSVFGGYIFKILNNIPHMLTTTSKARLLHICIYYSIKVS